MRFVRAHTVKSTGEIYLVHEQETPFDPRTSLLVELPTGERLDIEAHELGLAEDFVPTIPATGAACCPAEHLRLRLEPNPAAGAAASGAARFRAKAGHEADVPTFHAVPTTLDGIKALARANGPAAIHERVAHWLEFMGALSGDEMDAHGFPRLTISRAAEFDAMRLARDPGVGSRLDGIKRMIRERAARRGG